MPTAAHCGIMNAFAVLPFMRIGSSVLVDWAATLALIDRIGLFFAMLIVINVNWVYRKLYIELVRVLQAYRDN